jgi:hypothetical protein
LKRTGGLAAVLLGGLLVFSGALHVTDAAARQRVVAAPPEAPAPGYVPRFVTQTDERPPWNDCLWASGAMLLDKWTHGRATPERQVLRRASGDAVGGSRLSDLARAITRLYGWRPKFSPDGGERLTWPNLLERLASGGGAVLAGDYGRLGAPFTRWDWAYAHDPKAGGHAVYVDRFDERAKRIWLMDPLGRDGYTGEWVPVERVHAFVWKRNGFVFAMPTAAPPQRSVTGYVPGTLTLATGSHRAGDLVPASLPLMETGPWELPNLVVVSHWALVAPDIDAAETAKAGQGAGQMVSRAPLRPHRDDTPRAAGNTTSGAGQPPPSTSLQTWLALPDEPGLYQLTATVERGDSRPMPRGWAIAPVVLRVWGDRGAVVMPVLPTAALAAGQPLALAASIENGGVLPWTYGDTGPKVGEDDPSDLTQLVAQWVDVNGAVTPATAPLMLGLGPGEVQDVTLELVAPPLPGTFTLVLDVVDGEGSLLAPEDTAHVLLVDVGPAPVPTVAPQQND